MGGAVHLCRVSVRGTGYRTAQPEAADRGDHRSLRVARRHRGMAGPQGKKEDKIVRKTFLFRRQIITFV